MNKSTVLILLSIILIITPKRSYSWYQKGHQIISEIALNYLDSTTKANVQKYLGNTSFEEASIWMDMMRYDYKYSYMNTWHYINIEKGEIYKASNDENIINELDKVLKQLKNRKLLSNDEVKKNLLILFHLIGDLHQPLHVGYAIDRGGNSIQVNYLGHTTNLHSVWDDEIIQHENVSTKNCLAIYNSLTKEQADSLKEINTIDWMMQSRSLLDDVYNFNDSKIDDNYSKKMKPIIEKQLLYAGLRLGAILKSYFKHNT